MRAALVENFRDNAAILIATEAAAEGINLQFCNLVVNYDLPWNPQRIEQRIGRCHRYGQKFDVVVVNFIKLAQRFSFGVEDLDGLRPGKVFLQKSIDACDSRPHHVVTTARAFAKPGRCREKQRHRQQRHQCQAHVHPQHHADDRKDHHEVAQDISHSLSEEFVECVHVVGKARHDATNGIAIVVGYFLVL